VSQARLIEILRERGPTSAADLRSQLGLSAPTLSRLVRGQETLVARLGRGPATRYALRRQVTGLPPELPVYRVDVAGEVAEVGRLILLAGGEHWLQPAVGPGDHFEGLPPIVHDMAPQGFLGRQFSDWHPELQLPPRLQDWSDDDRLTAVARREPDPPGDLIIGEESLERFLQSAHQEIEPADYPERSRESARGGAGSLAGGEQPKFAVCGAGGQLLVKFTSGDGSPSDERWADLLACEAVAAEVMAEAGLPSATASLVDVGNQRFLEVERFDRVDHRGRRGVLTLGPLDDDLFGRRDSWAESARRLYREGLLSETDARRVRLLDAFGARIGNTDRHFGNISFFADGLRQRPRLELAPAYDMLPMYCAPRAGMVSEVEAYRASPRARWLDVWEEAGRMAETFWERVAGDSRISKAFRDGIS